jgi:hypothetical protein
MPAPRLLFLGSLLLTLSVVVPTFAQDDDDVVTVDSSIVVLNATVTDPDGRHVPGLKKAQFKILENGIEQEVSMFAAEDTPFAAVVLV